MAQYLDVEGLKLVIKDYNDKDKKKVDVEEGKGLYPDTDKEKLAGVEAQANVNKLEGVKINGVELVIGEDKKVDITPEKLVTDLEEYVKDTELTEQLTPYLKSSDAESTYVKESDFDSKVEAKIGEFGTIQGSCEKADLESKKEGAKENDVWIVTDDDNHMYFYNGTDFVDTQAKAHVDLSNYVEKDGDKVLVSPTDVTQITTNKTSIESLQSTVAGKANSSDLPTAIETETIQGIISSGGAE